MAEKQNLLSRKERVTCQVVAEHGEPPHRQRAVALLAIDNGAPQAEAVLESGLSIGQLKYCLVRFRKVGLAMFPEIPATRAAPAEALTEAVSVEGVEDTLPLEAAEAKKDKKSKKAKKKDKNDKVKASVKKEKKSGKKKKKGKKSKKK